MTPQDFIYWLQGFLELSGAKTLSEEQLTIVREHLALVMRKETPEQVVKKWPEPKDITDEMMAKMGGCITSVPNPMAPYKYNNGGTGGGPNTVLNPWWML